MRKVVSVQAASRSNILLQRCDRCKPRGWTCVKLKVVSVRRRHVLIFWCNVVIDANPEVEHV